MADEDQDLTTGEEIQERPEWLPPNFERPEDLAKSFLSAEQKITELGQGRSAAETRAAEAEARLAEIEQLQYQQQQQGQMQDWEGQLAEQLESGDGRTILQTIALVSQQAAKQAMEGYQPPQQQDPNAVKLMAAAARQELASKYDDWDEVSPKVGELLQQHPGLFTATPATPLEDVVEQLDGAYRLAKGFESQKRDAVTDSLNETNRLIKNQAQTLSGQSARQDEPTMWDKIKASSGELPSFRDVK